MPADVGFSSTINPTVELSVLNHCFSMCKGFRCSFVPLNTPTSIRSSRRVHRERDLYFVAQLRRGYGTHGFGLVQHDGLKHIRGQVLKHRGVFTNGCSEADGVGVRPWRTCFARGTSSRHHSISLHRYSRSARTSPARPSGTTRRVRAALVRAAARGASLRSVRAISDPIRISNTS